MARPKSKNPRRERLVFYLTESDAKMLDKFLITCFPEAESESERLKSMALSWMEWPHVKGRKYSVPEELPAPTEVVDAFLKNFGGGVVKQKSETQGKKEKKSED